MYKNILQKICGFLTNHRYSRQIGISTTIKPTEYHHKCKICKYRFWNYKNNDLERND